MYFNASDDDDGSTFSMGMPTGSNLSSLFGADKKAIVGGNESLMYVPPKQPNLKDENEPLEQKGDGTSLMYAFPFHMFRYSNGQYVSQGKLGLAVLGNVVAKEYKILIYVSQKKPVASSKIHSNYVFNVQKNNYASFFDDRSQNWSIRFDSEEQLIEVAKRVTLAKFNISPNALVYQDLNQQTSQEIQKGDTVEVIYTEWLHDGISFGKVLDTNENSGKLLKFKVGKGKVVKGLEMGVVGMKKMSKRIIIMPPDLATESKNVGHKIPPNTAVIFQVEITRVKYANPQPDNDSVSLASVDTSNVRESELENADEEDSVDIHVKNEALISPAFLSDSLKERKKSIPEQPSKPESSKSKLLERMSKMGKSIIPSPTMPTSLSTEEDSQEDATVTYQERVCEQISPKPQVKPKPGSLHSLQGLPVSSQESMQSTQSALFGKQMYQAPIDTNSFDYPQQVQQSHHQQQQSQQQQQLLALYQSSQGVHPGLLGYSGIPQMSSHASTMSATEMSLMLTDGRLKHTEIKTDLTRIVDTVNLIASKVSNLESMNKQQIFTHAPEMEASMIMQNITRIIKENEKLRLECEEKASKIEILNDRMSDLLTKNQEFFEKSNLLLANQTDSMHNSAAQSMAKVTLLEDQNMNLQAEMAALRLKIQETQQQLETSFKNEGQLHNKIKILQEELKSVKQSADASNDLAAEKEAIITELNEGLKDIKDEQKQTHLELTRLKEDNAKLKEEKEFLNKSLIDVKMERKSDKEKNYEKLEKLTSHNEVKQVMNAVFFKVRDEFEPNEAYTGRKVVATLLATIKEITLKMIERTDASASDGSDCSDLTDESEGDDQEGEDRNTCLEKEEKTLVEGEIHVNSLETNQGGQLNIGDSEHVESSIKSDIINSESAFSTFSKESVSALNEFGDSSICKSVSGTECHNSKSIGDSGDEQYATDEGECNEECRLDIHNNGSKGVVIDGKNTENNLIPDLIKTVDNNHHILDTVVHPSSEVENLSNTSTDLSNEDLKTQMSYSCSDNTINGLYNEQDGVDCIKQLRSLQEVDSSSNILENTDLQATKEGPGVGSATLSTNLNSSSNKELPADIYHTIDSLNHIRSSFIHSDTTTLQASSQCSDLSNTCSSNIVSNTNTSETLGKEKDKNAYLQNSIFDDSDNDDSELFNPKTVHKVSPFSRSPPPLFDGNDDDVNWM